MILRARYYDYAGTLVADVNFYQGAESAFGATWQPFMLWAVPPAGAVKAKLYVAAESTADLWLLNPEVH